MILAMGATHTKEKKLKEIVQQMQTTIHTSTPTNILNYDVLFQLGVSIPTHLQYQVEAIMQTMYYNLYWIAEIKEDGFSYICDDQHMYSRSLSTAKETKGQPVEKSTHVPHITLFFKQLKDVHDISVDIHGELYYPNKTSDDVTKIMGCTVDKAIARQQEMGWLDYLVYDLRSVNGINICDQPWYFRRAILEIIMLLGHDACNRINTYMRVDPKITISRENRNHPSDHIRISQVFTGDPRQKFSQVVSTGGEGLMLKDTLGKYIPGKKPANQLGKSQEGITADVVITGFDMNGTGKNENLFRSIKVGMYEDGELIEMGTVNSGISDGLRQQMFASMDCQIGKVIEITAMEATKKGMFRSARFIKFRDDKSANECIFERYDQFAPCLDMLLI